MFYIQSVGLGREVDVDHSQLCIAISQLCVDLESGLEHPQLCASAAVGLSGWPQLLSCHLAQVIHKKCPQLHVELFPLYLKQDFPQKFCGYSVGGRIAISKGTFVDYLKIFINRKNYE